jgi:hypothetical protein
MDQLQVFQTYRLGLDIDKGVGEFVIQQTVKIFETVWMLGMDKSGFMLQVPLIANNAQ